MQTNQYPFAQELITDIEGKNTIISSWKQNNFPKWFFGSQEILQKVQFDFLNLLYLSFWVIK